MSNEARAITSSIPAREILPRPMPRVVNCAPEKTFPKALPSFISKIVNNGADRSVADNRAQSRVRRGSLRGPPTRRRRRSEAPHQFCNIQRTASGAE